MAGLRSGSLPLVCRTCSRCRGAPLHVVARDRIRNRDVALTNLLEFNLSCSLTNCIGAAVSEAALLPRLPPCAPLTEKTKLRCAESRVPKPDELGGREENTMNRKNDSRDE